MLLSKKQNPDLVSKLIEHPDFTHLINAIDVYVRQIAAPNIGAFNNITRIAERGIENYYSNGKDKPEGYEDAIRFLNETVVNEDEFLRYRITERFNQILRDVYKEYAVEFADMAEQRSVPMEELTANILTVLDKIKSGEVKVDSIEDSLAAMMVQMGVTEEEMLAGLLGD